MAGAWQAIAAEGELEREAMKAFELDGRRLLLVHADGRHFVVDEMCSHEDYSLYLGCIQGRKIKCSLHGSYFDLASGAAGLAIVIAGVVMVPKHNQVKVKQIEFVPLSETRILVILVTSDGEVQNRVIETGKKFSQSDLVQAQNYLNANYGGEKLETMRTRIVEDLEKTRQQMDAVMQQALNLAGQVLGSDRKERDFVLSGQTNLMGFNELSDLERLRHLFDSFAEKRHILHLLDRCMAADGVQIFIGEESDYEPFDSCSLITAPYENDDGEVAGVLGVVGPTRMDYNKVIPIVDVTAKLLSNALKQR